MGKQLMTDETKSILLKSIDKRIENTTRVVDFCKSFILKIEIIEQSFSKNKFEVQLNTLKGMTRFMLIVGIITLDLSSSMRFYLISKHNYERLYSLRQLIVIINEGYKKIYGFITISNKGNTKTKLRENSFWVKEMGSIISLEFPELHDKYNIISSELESLDVIDFEKLYDQRNLSIHYDRDPFKVYDMISEINAEDLLWKLIPFIKVLDKITGFTEIVINSLNLKLASKKDNIKSMFETSLVKLEQSKNDRNKPDIEKLQEDIKVFLSRFFNN